MAQLQDHRLLFVDIANDFTEGANVYACVVGPRSAAWESKFLPWNGFSSLSNREVVVSEADGEAEPVFVDAREGSGVRMQKKLYYGQSPLDRAKHDIENRINVKILPLEGARGESIFISNQAGIQLHRFQMKLTFYSAYLIDLPHFKGPRNQRNRIRNNIRLSTRGKIGPADRNEPLQVTDPLEARILDESICEGLLLPVDAMGSDLSAMGLFRLGKQLSNTEFASDFYTPSVLPRFVNKLRVSRTVELDFGANPQTVSECFAEVEFI